MERKECAIFQNVPVIIETEMNDKWVPQAAIFKCLYVSIKMTKENIPY